MKRKFFMAALASVALVGCVNEELNYESPQKTLKFDAPALSQTRANVMGEISGTTYPVDEDFMVFCKSYTGTFNGWEKSTAITNYFSTDGDVATQSDGSFWATEKTYVWPDKDHNLAFAAYSPAVLGKTDEDGTTNTKPTYIAHTEEGLQITNFQVEPKADDQYDLMYSERVVDRNILTHGSQAVPLNFKHALTSIVFSAEKGDDMANYTITDLKLTGEFYTQGNFNQGITETPAKEATDSEAATSYSSVEVPTWTCKDGDKKNVSYAPSFDDFSVSTTPTKFTEGPSALLLIPQKVPADAEVEITYTKTSGSDTGASTLENTIKVKLSDFKYTDAENNSAGIETWTMGHRYVYRISFGENKKIYFEPTVTDWVQHATLIYTVQQTNTNPSDAE